MMFFVDVMHENKIIVVYGELMTSILTVAFHLAIVVSLYFFYFFKSCILF